MTSHLGRFAVATVGKIANPSIVKGKRGVFLDDSIVRGTQLRDNVRALFAAGIKEVHMRIACPPLTHSCLFLNFSRSSSIHELAAHKAVRTLEGREEPDMKAYSQADTEHYCTMVEQIRKELGFTTLAYQTLEDLVEAIGLPKEKLCTHCWDGTSFY